VRVGHLREKGEVLIETELKIQIDPGCEARLRQLLAQLPGREGAVRSRSLVSIYCDTSAQDLARGGIALRLRRDGRRWVQSVKKASREASRGLFAATEIERPAPGGRLRLDGEDPSGIYGEIRARVNGADLAAVFETRVKRTTARLRGERGVVEVALDRGELIAGALSAPIREAELELVEGEVGAIFDVARRLFPDGVIRFSSEPKSSRGLRLATSGRADQDPQPRKAGTPDFSAEATVEAAARDALRDCLAQVADNIVLMTVSDASAGPHQLRIGLRRLRTVIAAFKRMLGPKALAPVAQEARRLGRVVGGLRDLDVLVEKTFAEASAGGLDPTARDALLAPVEARRQAARAEVRAALAAPDATCFLFDLAELIEGRGWLVPSDYSQSERLATPVGEVAPAVIERRYRKVIKRGRHIAALDEGELHELRKELKKLRYTVELMAPLYGGKARKKFVKALNGLQDSFGGLNDAATTAGLLLCEDAPGSGDPAAQRAAGWVLGRLAAVAEADRARLAARWKSFEKLDPHWR
jgi:triphosphatase